MFLNAFASFGVVLTACLPGMFPASANAQESERSEAGPSVSMLLLAPHGPVAELHSIVGDRIKGPVRVHSARVSEPLFPGARAFSLAIADATSAQGFKAVATVTLPQSGKDFIALLQPEGERYNVMLIDKDSPGFRQDSIALYNAADAPIGFSAGGKRVLINPKKLAVVQPPPREEKPYYQLQLYEIRENEPKILTNTRWPHRNRSRLYLFFYRNETTGRIVWQAVDEIIDRS